MVLEEGMRKGNTFTTGGTVIQQFRFFIRNLRPEGSSTILLKEWKKNCQADLYTKDNSLEKYFRVKWKFHENVL